MHPNVLAAALLLAVAPSAFGQSSKKSGNALTPTDILDFGEISGTFRLEYRSGAGSIASPFIDRADIDFTEFRMRLEGAVGLGMGFEAELELPFQIQGGMEGDGELAGGGGSFDLEDEEAGLGDLTLIGNYRILTEGSDTPHFMVGLLAVLPLGNDDISQAELSGAISSPGEDGGIGGGVFQAGLQAGVSKKFGPIEPYALLRILLPFGEHEDGDTSIDEPEKMSLTLGSEFELAKSATLDTRLILTRAGEKTTERTGSADEVEEANLEIGLEVRGYVDLGQGITLVAGVGGIWLQDHALDKDGGIDLEDMIGYGAEIGLHIRLGAFQ